MNFFFDNMMSHILAKMIAVLKEEIHHVIHIKNDPRFGPDSKDPVWFKRLAADKLQWNIISGDITMFLNPSVLADFHDSDLIFFCMDENWCSGNTDNSQAWKLLKLWPDIEARARGPRPAFYEVNTGNRPCLEELRASRRARRRRLEL